VGELDWRRRTGPTPSADTGPDSAYEGGWYLYTEATGNYKETAILQSPCLDLTTVSCPALSFWYHMYGSQMGSLSVEVSNDLCSTWTIVWPESAQPKSGNQGNAWHHAQVGLSAHSESSVTIRFVGVTGNGYRSDMALDDVCVVGGDFDVDGDDDVDLYDFGAFQGCFGDDAVTSDCSPADSDGNGLIDSVDCGVFPCLMTGPL
jgi:hypothetical protein